MANRGFRTNHLWLPNSGDDHTFELIKVLTALKCNFRERKKTQTTELNIFLSKNKFSTENNKEKTLSGFQTDSFPNSVFVLTDGQTLIYELYVKPSLPVPFDLDLYEIEVMIFFK